MSKDLLKAFIEALKNGKEYGFISTHYYEMSSEDLARIIKEYSFAIYQFNEGLIEDIEESIMSCLTEYVEEYDN